MSAWNTALENPEETDINVVAANIIQQMATLGDKFGYDQGQILTIRAKAVEKGIEGSLFQPILERDKRDNIPLFNK